MCGRCGSGGPGPVVGDPFRFDLVGRIGSTLAARPRGGSGAARRAGRGVLVEKFLKKKLFSRLVLTIKINLDIVALTTTKEVMIMKINEIVARVIETTLTQGGKKYTQTMIADELGVKPQHISDRLKNENMKVNTAIEMLNMMGYDLVVRPREEGRETYVVEKGGLRDK